MQACPSSAVGIATKPLGKQEGDLRSLQVVHPTNRSSMELITEGSKTTEDEEGVLQPHFGGQSFGTSTLYPLLRIAIPCVVSLVFMFGTQTVTMAFVGHRMGFTPLSHFSVGLSVFNILAAAVGFGFAGAIDTIAPQTFGRDPTASLVPLYHTAQLWNLVLLVPVSTLLCGSLPVMKIIYGEELGSGAYEVLRWTPIYAFLMWHTRNLSLLFSAQHLAVIPLYANVAGTVAGVSLCYMMLHQGSTMVTVIGILCATQLVSNVTLVGAAALHPKSRLKHLYRPGSLHLDIAGVKYYGALGFYACVTLCASWWSFEVLQIFAAQLGTLEVAAFTILLNIVTITNSNAIGICMGGGTLMGNALGAGDAHLAQRYLVLTVKVLAVVGASTVAVLNLFGHSVFSFYTNDTTFLAVLEPLATVVGLWHCFDAAQTFVLQMYTRVGEQHLASRGMVVCMWLVGIPCAYAGALFFSFGIVGIIGGQCVGILVLIVWLGRDMCQWNFHSRCGCQPSRCYEYMWYNNAG